MNKSLKVALIGYGKMGKEIEKILIERGHKVGAIANYENPLTDSLIKDCDVAIEFTQPDAAVNNITFCATHQLPVVVGTTGWYEQYDEIQEIVKVNNSALLTATNFSVGVNIFFHVNQLLAKLMNNYPEYEVSVDEIHHKQKKDAPSGTAITTVENILSGLSHKNAWTCIEEGESKNIKENEIPIFAFREDNVPGVHKVKWNSEIDLIEFSHTAHNRKGFALGSVLAAEWLTDKKGVFKMKDMLGF